MVTQNVINGFLGGLGHAEAMELDVVDLTDSQVVEVLEGLGAHRKHPNYKRAMSNAVRSFARRNKRNAVQIRKPDSKMMTGKAKFEKRISQIENDDIRKGLASGAYTIADFEVYAIKKADKNVVEMFLTSDDRREGVTNINDAKLDNRTAMLVTHIAFQEGVAAAPSGDDEADGASVDFDKITPNTANAEYNFKNGQKSFIERGSMDVFKRKESDGLRIGEVELEVPKLIQEAKEITFDVKMFSTPVANTYFKVMLKGVAVVKA